MSEIQQNSLASHHSVDETARHPGDNRGVGVNGRQLLDDSSDNSISGSVNISFNAHMRLQAYQDQNVQSIVAQDDPLALKLTANALSDTTPNQSSDNVDSERVDDSKLVDDNAENENPAVLNQSDKPDFSKQITGMLTEVENNIVQASEPGYRYLVNMLSNYQTTVEDPQQLQEIMRKEEFYLTRRRPFMDSAEFQSYSQVLNQFSNIVARQQYA